MKTTINEWDFVHYDALKANFSYDGRIALFNALEQLEEDCAMEFDFDLIAIRCDYTEYANLADFWNDYDRYEYQCMRDIEDNTIVIYIPDSEAFIIQQF